MFYVPQVSVKFGISLFLKLNNLVILPPKCVNLVL